MHPPDSLEGHIRANGLKSALLIAGFPMVVPAAVAVLVLLSGMVLGSRAPLSMAAQTFSMLLVAMIVITLIWLPIGYLINQWIIDRATGARLLDRHEEGRLWALHENLCARCGMRLPALRIIETDVMNAYASGLSEGRYSVTVTRGLLDTLSDDELEAVLAHELTHIRNHDVRLLVVATVLVGMIPMLHDIVMRVFWVVVMAILNIYRAIFTAMRFPLAKLLAEVGYFGMFWVGKGFAFVVGIVAHISSLMIHFALSRRREFMADAGAVAMTGKPEAMIAALRRISGCSTLETEISGVRAMLFDSPAVFSLGGLFDTHPSIEARIEALARHAATPVERPRTTARIHEPTEPSTREAATPRPPADLVQRFSAMLQRAIGERGRRMPRPQRLAVYARARETLLAQLRSDAALSEEDAEGILAALYAAVAELEAADEQGR